MELAKACLYTIRKAEGLAESGGTSRWAVKQRYVAAGREFERATAMGLAMPVVIADADDRSRVIASGILTEVGIGKSGTQLRVEKLQPLSGRSQQELRVLKSGKPLASGFSRAYALVQTPGYLLKDAATSLPEGMVEFPFRSGLPEEAPIQEWRAAHPHGCVLTFVTGSRALLLNVNCNHVGRLRPGLEETASLSPRRLCAESAEVLRAWAHSNKVHVDTCRQCEREARRPDAATDAVAGNGSAVMQHLLEAEEQREISRIGQRVDIAPLEKALLLGAQRGHGVFRENVEKIETACRVTGVLDRRHLRASHIKPWCRSDDREKLDGYNGLLLSPHIDHLFVRGYISFADAGELLVAAQMNAVVLSTWRLAAGQKTGSFSPEQCRYLAYHREHIFEQEEGGRRGRGGK